VGGHFLHLRFFTVEQVQLDLQQGDLIGPLLSLDSFFMNYKSRQDSAATFLHRKSYVIILKKNSLGDILSFYKRRWSPWSPDFFLQTVLFQNFADSFLLSTLSKFGENLSERRSLTQIADSFSTLHWKSVLDFLSEVIILYACFY
jgi:hypothetical protein